MKATKLTIKLVLLVLIPLLVSALICVYASKRYVSLFPEYYIANLDESRNTEEKIERYIKYYGYYYEELTEIENAVQKDGYVVNENGDKLFSLKAYRWYFVDEDDSDNNNMEYVFVIYNVHYGNIFYTIYEKGKSPIEFNGYIPYFTLCLEDPDDEDNTYELEFYTNSDCTIEDYNYLGYEDTKRYENGNPINSDVTTRWAATKDMTNTFSENVNIKIKATDQYQADIASDDEEALEAATITAVDYDYSKFYSKISKLDVTNNTFYGVTLSEGYNQDYKAAGYNKYVFKTWLWWEALVAIALTLLVTGSTVIVWSAEDVKETKNKSKIKK